MKDAMVGSFSWNTISSAAVYYSVRSFIKLNPCGNSFKDRKKENENKQG